MTEQPEESGLLTQTVTYINTPASFGVEVAQTYGDGHTHVHQLANPRGTMTLLFGTRYQTGKWGPAYPVSQPERFMDAAPQSNKDWETIVEKWLSGAKED